MENEIKCFIVVLCLFCFSSRYANGMPTHVLANTNKNITIDDIIGSWYGKTVFLSLEPEKKATNGCMVYTLEKYVDSASMEHKMEAEILNVNVTFDYSKSYVVNLLKNNSKEAFWSIQAGEAGMHMQVIIAAKNYLVLSITVTGLPEFDNKADTAIFVRHGHTLSTADFDSVVDQLKKLGIQVTWSYEMCLDNKLNINIRR